MSHAAGIPTVGTRAPSVRKPALATLALVIPLLVVIAVAIVLVATGPGAGTQNTIASDGPGGSDAAAVPHPRSVPAVRPAPTRGAVPVPPQSAAVVLPRRVIVPESLAQPRPGLAGKDEAATAAAIGAQNRK